MKINRRKRFFEGYPHGLRRPMTLAHASYANSPGSSFSSLWAGRDAEQLHLYAFFPLLPFKENCKKAPW